MLATFSPEQRINEALKNLGCVPSNFAHLASGILGKTRLHEGLAGRGLFEPADAERLLALLGEMAELQQALDENTVTSPHHVPIDWSRVGAIEHMLVIRRVARIAAELDGSENEY